MLRSRNAVFRSCWATLLASGVMLKRMSTNTRASTSDISLTTNPAGRWRLDPSHSTVSFSVRHLMITNVRGELSSFGGAVTFDPSVPEATRIEATIDVASLSTREAKRDDDLLSPLFFDAQHHPHMTFTSVRARSDTCHP